MSEPVYCRWCGEEMLFLSPFYLEEEIHPGCWDEELLHHRDYWDAIFKKIETHSGRPT